MADGLTPDERNCLLHLAEAWNLFVALPTKHPSETHEFQSAIHSAQGLIAFRVAMRVNPDDWYQPAASADPTEFGHDPHARAKSRYEYGDESERDAYVADVVDHITESTYDSGEDHELEACIAEARDLVPDSKRSIFERYQDPGLSPVEVEERWQAFRKELEECRSNEEAEMGRSDESGD